jgi:hypothetical protein
MTSQTSWNLEQLREHVLTKCDGDKQILERIESVSRGVGIFGYHKSQARDALKGLVNDTEPPDIDAVRLFFDFGGRRQELASATLASEAHLIGCLHVARANWDHFAQLVNALQPVPLVSESDCDISKVATKLADSPLKSAIADSLSSHWFRYVLAFINVTKHRRLIRHGLSLQFAEERVGMAIGAFSYGGQEVKPYWATEVLEGACDVSNRLVDCGRMLNEHVRCIAGREVV